MPRYKASPRHKKRYTPLRLSSSSSSAIDNAVVDLVSQAAVLEEQSPTQIIEDKTQPMVSFAAEAEVREIRPAPISEMYRNALAMDNDAQEKLRIAEAVLDAIGCQYRKRYASLTTADKLPPDGVSQRDFDRALIRYDAAVEHARDTSNELKAYREDFDVLDLLGL